MKNIGYGRILGLLALGACLATHPCRLSAGTRAASPGLSAPLRAVLPNGLTVILQEDHRAPVAAVQMWVKTGSGDETDPESGLSHVLEHMLFKGTRKRGVGEIGREIERAGGRINAFTSYDETVFHLIVPRENLAEGIDIISDAIRRSSFDPSELTKELEVVMEEVRRQEDMPEARLEKALFSTAYTVHPYRRPVIGTSATVEKFTRDRIVGYYRRWYAPNNMALVISGDFAPQSVLSLVKASFGEFVRKRLPPRPRPIEPAQMQGREVILEEDVKESHFSLGWHIPGIKNTDIYALDVLAQILGGGDSSRLVRKVKEERQLVNSISAYSYTPRDPGLFIVEASLEAEKCGEALSAALREAARLSTELVEDSELSRAKINLVSQFVYEAETAEGVAHQLGYFEAVAGDINFRQKYTRAIEAVTKEDVRRVARIYLKDTTLTMAGLFPRGQAPKSLASLLELESRKLSVASVEHGPGGVTKVTFDGGPVLLIKEDHSEPVAALTAVFEGGQRDEAKGKEGSFNFMAGMLTRGTPTRDREEIAREVESMASSLDASSGRTHFFISGRVLSRFLDRYLDLYTDVLLHPSFDPTEAGKERNDILMAIKNQEDSLARTAFRTFARALYGTHPFGKDPLGTKESVGALTPDDLRSVYARYARRGDLVLSVVGDVSTDHIISAYAAGLSSMPTGRATRREIAPPQEPRSVKKETKTIAGKEQTHMLLGFLATTILDDDRYPLLVLSNILSNMGGRLFVELRDKKSLAYAVAAILSEGLWDRGYFAVYLACRPNKLSESVEGALNELDKIRKDGVTDDEVSRAKSFLIGNHTIGLQGTSAMASTLAGNEANGLGYGFYLTYPKKIEAVTRDDVLRVARKYLVLDRYTLAVVGGGQTPGDTR